MDNQETPASELGAPQHESRVGRRRLIGAGLAGATMSLLPFLSHASASTPDEPDDTSPDGSPRGTSDIDANGGVTGVTEDSAGGPSTTAAAPTTTTSAPKRPTDADVPMLDFLQGIEIAARELYDVALDGALLNEEQRVVLGAIGQSHRSYGQALSGLLGRQASNAASTELFDAMSGGFGGNIDELLDAAYELENTLVATHLDVIGQLEGTDAAQMLAALVTVEGRNGVVLASMAGKTDLDDLLVADEADPMAAGG